jgi:DNA-binding FadR family transcriptional regulator
MKKAMTDISEIMEFDRDFHINIARAVHNDLLFVMMAYLADLLNEKLWINLKEKSLSIPGRPQKYYEEYAEILNAIKSKDSKGASKGMYNHLTGVEKDLFSE